MKVRWTRSAAVLTMSILVVGTISACGGPTSDDASGSKQHTIVLSKSHGVFQASDGLDNFVERELHKAGYATESLYLQESEDSVQAVVRGDADFGETNPVALTAAIGQGAPVVAIIGQSRPDYALVAPIDVKSPAELDGLRVGIHTKASTTALLVNLALKNYPDVKPNILVVPGSANRILAMAAGELDASPIQYGDVEKLEELAPGKFHVILRYSAEVVDYIDGMVFTSVDTLKNKPELVEAYIRAVLKGSADLYDEPERLVDVYAASLEGTSRDQAKEIAKIYLDAKVWITDGGFTPETIAFTLDALKTTGLMPKPVTVEQYADLTILDRVRSGK